MKFRVQMKDPDGLYDAVQEAAKKQLADIAGLTDDEREELTGAREETLSRAASKWFEYGEYLTVEIDVDAGTCVVVAK